jgi:hypothetical protein
MQTDPPFVRSYTIVVLANLDPSAPGRIERFVLERLPMK